MTELTNAVIVRLNAAKIEVKLWNGCFNIASAVAEVSRHKFELSVEVTHPLLKWQCGDKAEVSLVRWKGSNGQFLAIPDELLPLIGRMRLAATMTEAAAAKLSEENKLIAQATYASLGM